MKLKLLKKQTDCCWSVSDKCENNIYFLSVIFTLYTILLKKKARLIFFSILEIILMFNKFLLLSGSWRSSAWAGEFPENKVTDVKCCFLSDT